MHRLRDFLPKGVCDPPNPFVYRKLAELCEGNPEALQDSSSATPGHVLSDADWMRLHAHHHDPHDYHRAEYDPDRHGYIWDLPGGDW